MDINSGSDSNNPGDNMAVVVGDTLYFDADDGSAGLELWAHDTSNQSTWQVTDISSGSGNGNPGRYMQILVGDTICSPPLMIVQGMNCGRTIRPIIPRGKKWLISTTGL